MSGISYLVNEEGERAAVVIDLALHGELWEDFYDVLTAEARKDEPLESLQDVLQAFQNTKGTRNDL
jgi:hypothetical protein